MNLKPNKFHDIFLFKSVFLNKPILGPHILSIFALNSFKFSITSLGRLSQNLQGMYIMINMESYFLFYFLTEHEQRYLW